MPDKPSSPSTSAQPPSDAEEILGNDTRMDVIDEKDKKKVEKKKKDLVFFQAVELVDLDDCDVPDMRLQCNNKDMDDDDALNPDDMDVGDGGASNSQCLEPNIGPTTEPLQSSI